MKTHACVSLSFCARMHCVSDIFATPFLVIAKRVCVDQDLLEINLSLAVVAGSPNGGAAADPSGQSASFEQEVQFIKKIDGVLPMEDCDRFLIVTSFVDAWLMMKHVFGANSQLGCGFPSSRLARCLRCILSPMCLTRPTIVNGFPCDFELSRSLLGLCRQSRSGASASSKFSKALVEIESTLHQSVMQSSAGSANADALRAVQTVADECAFWTEAAARDRRAGNSPAAFFARTLGKIAPRLRHAWAW
jgi:hypothetical protein